MLTTFTRLTRTSFVVFTLIAVAMIVGSTSAVLARPANTLDTPVTLWPTPGSAGTKFWWSYRWYDGPRRQCPNDGRVRNVAIVADYLNDGAYNDSSLLSLSFFKDDPCTYWWSNNNGILRWYSKRMVNSNTWIYDSDPYNPDNYVNQFFSFRGLSMWTPYRGGASVTGISDPSRTTTDLYNASNGLVRQISGRYAVNIDGVFTYNGGYTYTYNDGDNAQIPNYPIFGNRKIDRDIVLSRNSSYRTTPVTSGYVQKRYFSGDWNLQRSGTTPSTSYDKADIKYMRKTSFTWEGKPVYYVAYMELGDSSSTGPSGEGSCEEWWYAQDIGPIYIAAYNDGDSTPGLLSRSTCENSIALNKTFYNGVGLVSYINNPEGYFATNPQNLVGYIKQDARCIILGCRVDY